MVFDELYLRHPPALIYNCDACDFHRSAFCSQLCVRRRRSSRRTHAPHRTAFWCWMQRCAVRGTSTMEFSKCLSPLRLHLIPRPPPLSLHLLLSPLRLSRLRAAVTDAKLCCFGRVTTTERWMLHAPSSTCRHLLCPGHKLKRSPRAPMLRRGLWCRSAHLNCITSCAARCTLGCSNRLHSRPCFRPPLHLPRPLSLLLCLPLRLPTHPQPQATVHSVTKCFASPMSLMKRFDPFQSSSPHRRSKHRHRFRDCVSV
jgi:hypothetical protein